MCGGEGPGRAWGGDRTRGPVAGGQGDPEKPPRRSGLQGPRSQVLLMLRGTRECPVCGRWYIPKS